MALNNLFVPETEAIINSKAPANAAKEDLVGGGTDAQNGIITVPDTTQQFADILKTTAGIAPQEDLDFSKSQVTPPSWYEPDKQKDVIGGNISNAMGTLPLMSTGIPMFSPAILQQAEDNLRQAKALAYNAKMKDVKDLKKGIVPYIINDNIKNAAFLRYENDFYKGLVDDAMTYYGTPEFDDKKMDIILGANKMKALKQAYDTAYDNARMAVAIHEKGLSDDVKGMGKRKGYVGDRIFKLADEFLRQEPNSDFYKQTPEEKMLMLGKLNKEFYIAESIDESTKDLVTKLNNLEVTTDLQEKWRSNIQRVLAGTRLTGLAAIDKATDDYIREDVAMPLYEESYAGVKKEDRPNFDKWYEVAKAKVKSKESPVFQKISSYIGMQGGAGGKTPIDNSSMGTARSGGYKTNVSNFAGLPTPIQSPSQAEDTWYNLTGKNAGKGVSVIGYSPEINQVLNYKSKKYGLTIPIVLGTVKLEDEGGNMVYKDIFSPLMSNMNAALEQKYKFTNPYSDIESKDELFKIKNIIEEEKEFIIRQALGLDKGTTTQPPQQVPQNRKQFKNSKTGKLEWFVYKNNQWIKE